MRAYTLERLGTPFPPGQAQSIEVCFGRTELTLRSLPLPFLSLNPIPKAAVPVIWMEGRRRGLRVECDRVPPPRASCPSKVRRAGPFIPHLLPSGGGGKGGCRLGGGGVDRNQYKTGLHVLSLAFALPISLVLSFYSTLYSTIPSFTLFLPPTLASLEGGLTHWHTRIYELKPIPQYTRTREKPSISVQGVFCHATQRVTSCFSRFTFYKALCSIGKLVLIKQKEKLFQKRIFAAFRGKVNWKNWV